MTGQLRTLNRILAAIADDLGMEGRAPSETEAAAILSALEFAITTRKTAELARLVQPWLDGQLAATFAGRGMDEQTREDAIAGLK